MNYKLILRIQGYILLILAAMLIPPLGISVYTSDVPVINAYIITILIALGLGALFVVTCKKTKIRFYTREGLCSVGLAWIVLSVVGCLPFFLSGRIPNFFDALFEIVSGLTTTGASVVSDVEALGKGLLWWRSFSHWIGGMGVLVFFLAIIPLTKKSEGFSLHILRAESPGPVVNKIAPRMRESATILYGLYFGLTILNIIFLLIGKMPFFDACCIAFGTAGTGGFVILNSGFSTYTSFAQSVTTVFMLLFGVNFSLYYLMTLKKVKAALKDEELRAYIGIVIASILLITINVFHRFSETMTVMNAIHHSAFQVASIITTTGYSTVDFDLWPSLSKSILLILMFCGASAGSTGGGFKVSRVLLICKAMKRNIQNVIHPNRTTVVRMNKQRVNEKTINAVYGYLAIYIAIVIVSYFLISFDPGNFSIQTNISAVAATFNNIGPGFDSVGPVCNFSIYNNFSTLILTLDMLLGRLEIFPILALFIPSVYKKL